MTQEEIDALVKANEDMKKAIENSQTSIEKLTQKNRELIQAEKEEKKKAKEAQEAAAAAAEEAARKSGDVDALEKSWREKIKNETSARDTLLEEYKGMLKKMTVGSTAQAMAAELAISGSAPALLPHISKRLSVEVIEGNPIVRVLDKDGSPSALSLDDLKKEISAESAFAPLLVGSRATGTGEVGKSGSTGGTTIGRTAFDGMAPADRMKFIKDGGKIVDK